MTEFRERTPEEREAARLERERRRQGQVDIAPGAGDSVDTGGSGNGDGSGDGDELVDFDESVREDDSLDGDDGLDENGSPEQPAGTRRVGWRERTTAVAAARAEGEPAAPVRRDARSRRRSWWVRSAVALILILAAGVIWFAVEVFQPFHGSGHGSVSVTVPPHASARQVGDLLAREGVVSSGFFFYIRAKLDGDSGKLLAGRFHMRLGMSYGQALEVLTTPPPAAKVTNVTVIPGETRAQLNALLHSQGIRGSYLQETRHSPLLNPVAYGAPRGTPSLEGFLFPNTYQLRVPIRLGALIDDQLRTFKQTFARVNLSYARSRHLTPYDVLIIASIVEKEAASVRDDRLVASVIYNRLKDRMPLGMDSTTRYEFNDYNKPLTNSQLSARSPYNTRLNTGLTPTPISNPGLAAIQAAAQPAKSNYLYFVVKPGTCGRSVFSSSYSQFLADSARYQQARAANGGHSPTKC